jgi:hypothetical protein
MAHKTQVDWVLRIDFTLDYPVEAVWPLVVDAGEWIPTHRNEHVSGPRNAVGEIIRIWYSDETSGEELGSFPVEVASFIENHSLIYKFLPAEQELVGTGTDTLIGFEGFNLFPLGEQRTLGTMSQYAVAESTTRTRDELRASIAETNERLERLWRETYLPRLNKLLARGDDV